MTALSEDFLKKRFPKIYDTCKFYDLNIAKDQLPVSPASHYCMGGVRTDLHGRTSLKGLYAAGEVACTGVHGANRLASNSLLEGLVFGAQAGKAAAEDSLEFRVQSLEFAKDEGQKAQDKPRTGKISTAVRKRVKRVMWERVGILRDKDSLSRALKEFDQIRKADLGTLSRNFVTVATLITKAALWREESRGGHFRYDFPETLEKWRVHSIQKRGEEITSSASINFESIESEKPRPAKG
jgi:L-aspartate oxidase